MDDEQEYCCSKPALCFVHLRMLKGYSHEEAMKEIQAREKLEPEIKENI